jgi:glycosyltransferase involved in cell wall biosynthesis
MALLHREERGAVVKVVFVSGVSVGGSARSTRELAGALARRGHDVTVVLGRPRPAWADRVFQRGVNAWVKLEPGPASVPVLAALRWVGHGSSPVVDDTSGADVRLAYVPENAYLEFLDPRPDAVVVSSTWRAPWRWIRADLDRRAIPSVLYVREDHALGHLTVSDAPPDVLVANAEAHATRLAAAGHEAVVLPSVIDRTASAVESTRRTVLLVNPVPEYRVDLVDALAQARPDIPFVLQESWPLEPEARAEVDRVVGARGNVEFRPRVDDPTDLYRDARVLFAPYPSGRPRVVPEAQHNGIPVLAAAQPALAEAVGEGGALVDLDAPASVWLDALTALWDDDAHYADLSHRAREHDRRPELDPDHIVERFEALLAGAAATGARR